MQKLSEDYSLLAKQFMDNIRLKRSQYTEKKGIELIFGNVDQVPFEFDMSYGTTYDFTGKKEIKTLKTTGSKQRFTVQLCILANGQFLPPIFVFKSKGKIPLSLQQKFQNKALLYSWIGVKYEFKAIKHNPRYLCFYHSSSFFIILMAGFIYKNSWSSIFLKKNNFPLEWFFQEINSFAQLFFCLYIFPILAVLRKTLNYIETNFHKILEV